MDDTSATSTPDIGPGSAADEESAFESRRVRDGPIAALARISTFSSLQYRDYMLIWLGQISNANGGWMDGVTRSYLMYQLTGSPFQLGAVNAVRAIPLLSFSIIAGAAADRGGRKRQLIIAQWTNAALNFGLGILVITGQVQPWHVYVTALLAGTVQAFQQPARQSMISDIVPPHAIRNAVALNAMVLNTSRGVGPAVAGAVIAGVGAGGSYIVQGAMYAIGTIWTLQIHEPVHGARGGARAAGFVPAPQEPVLRSALAGVRYMWADQTVRAVMAVVLVPAVLGQPYISLLPIFAEDILHVGPAGQGQLLGLEGIGALAGAVTVASIGARGHTGLLMLLGATVFGISIFAFATSTLFPFSLSMMLLNGLFADSYNTQAQAILQVHTPPEMRGRIMGLYLMNRGMVPLGSLLAGALATWLGAPLAVEAMGVTCTVLALWALLTRPTVRAFR